MDQRSLLEHPTPSWADQAWMDENLRLRASELILPGTVGNHATAARLLGLPVPHRLSIGQLHVATTDPDKKHSRRGITVHRRTSLNPGNWLDLRLDSPAGVFAELASELDLGELVALGDAIVGNWHGPPLYSLQRLHTEFEARTYLRHRPQIETALGLIRENVDSPKETDLRLWFIERGLPEPIVHPEVICPALNRVVEPDLGYPDKMLAFEYEGDHHRLSKQQWNNDIERDEALRLEGWTVLKVTSRTDRSALEKKIRHHLGE